MSANGHVEHVSASGYVELAEGLTELLGLDAVGLRVTGAEVFGNGRNALVDLHLSGRDRPLRFESYGDIARPATLSAELMAQVGVVRTFKVAEALGAGAMVHELASHHAQANEDEWAEEWGREYLRLAATEAVDFGDQGERWRAFSALARINPARAAGDDRSAHALASCSVVLVDRDAGTRYVRAGWFQSYVKREVGGVYSPSLLVTQMQRVGWVRPNGQGKVKATAPSDAQSLAWSFYVVPAEWPEVTAGVSSYARVHVHTRGIVDLPVVTRNPDDHAEGSS